LQSFTQRDNQGPGGGLDSLKIGLLIGLKPGFIIVRGEIAKELHAFGWEAGKSWGICHNAISWVMLSRVRAAE
jgi:hypothetical protein